MKTLGLDIGDVWVGSALSDTAGISCKPYRTIKLQELETFLDDVLHCEPVSAIVVGHPITVGGGTASKQTKRIEEIFATLQKKYSSVNDRSIEWALWDERFSTKRAISTMRGKKGAKEREHSIAAAFVLQSYLDYKAFHAS